MPLLTVAAMNRSLDADYGADHDDDAPAAFTAHLVDGDPRDDGVEIVLDGLLTPTVTNNGTNFPPASGGVKVGAQVNMGTPTEEGPLAWGWMFKNAATGEQWEACQFRNPMDLPAGTGVAFVPEIAYDTEAI